PRGAMKWPEPRRRRCRSSLLLSLIARSGGEPIPALTRVGELEAPRRHRGPGVFGAATRDGFRVREGRQNERARKCPAPAPRERLAADATAARREGPGHPQELPDGHHRRPAPERE